MTNEQASEYAAAVQKLAPFNVGLFSAAAVAECLKFVGEVPNLHRIMSRRPTQRQLIWPAIVRNSDFG